MFNINGTSCKVRHADGTSEDLMALVARACKGTGASMDQIRAESTGNLRLSFDDSYFPRRGQISGPERSILNARKSRAHLAIYDALVAAGVDEGLMTFSVGFMGRNGWVGALSIYVNKQTRAAQTTKTAAVAETVGTLKSQFIAGGGDIDELVKWKTVADGDEDVMRGLLMRGIRAQAVAAETAAVAETVEADDEVPDTSTL